MPPASLRIIGGIYNGKKILFAPTLLRPSGARVRESLFSCLGQQLYSYDCLDLFAGTGALGLSAISRGASQVVFVEQNHLLAQNLKTLVEKWKSPARIITSPAQKFLSNNTQCFDIVFLDPPFVDYCQDASWHVLLDDIKNICKKGSRVYCESDRFFSLPSGWTVLKEKKIGHVHWQLLTLAL